MSPEDRDRLFARAMKAVKEFLRAKEDFEAVQDYPASDLVAVATAGRFVEAHEEMQLAVAELETYKQSLLLPTDN